MFKSVLYISFTLFFNSAIALSLDMTTFRQSNLLCHNVYREKHGVHPLSYNAKMNKEAQDFAERLALFDNFNTKSNTSYGENVYRMDENSDGYAPCDDWYKENEKYDYNKIQPSNYNEIGHFTQMVSRASCFMGAGLAKSKSGRLYVVILYYPNGNIRNEYRRNIFPPGTNRHKTTLVEAMMKNVACSDSDQETYQRQNLECHNVIREKYNVEPLAYTHKLNKIALEKAQWLAQRNDGLSEENNKSVKEFRVIFNGGLIDGYNYCQHVYDNGLRITIDAIHAMDKNGSYDLDVLGFSQMIWKSTRHMGFGMARSTDGKIYVVAVYDPIGNVKGQFKRNVLKPSDRNKEWLSPDPDSWERF